MNINAMVILVAFLGMVAGWWLAQRRAEQKRLEEAHRAALRQKEIDDEIQEVIVPTEAEGRRKRMSAMPFLPAFDPGDMSVKHGFLPVFSKAEDGVHVSLRGGGITGEIRPICARSAVRALSVHFVPVKKEIGDFVGPVYGPSLKDGEADAPVNLDLGEVVGFAFFTFEGGIYFRFIGEDSDRKVNYGPMTLGDAEILCARLHAVVEAIGPEAIDSSIVKVNIGKPKPRRVVVKGQETAPSSNFGVKA